MSNDLGIDRSGNGNNWTVNNMTYSDQMLDTPTNNFATFNAIDATNSTFSEGNLKFAHSSIPAFARSTMSMKSGKWYYEIIGTTQYGMHGVTTFESGMPTHWLGNDPSGWAYNYTDQHIRNSPTDYAYGDTYTTGDIIGIALDVDTPSITFYKNGVSQGTFTTNFPANKEWFFASGGDWSGASWIANFGQDSSFAGTKTAQGNQDSNGIGDFYYTPPSGFLALCTANLPNVAVKPSQHFNTVLYSGTGSVQTISGVGFQADFTWIKSRSNADTHTAFDILRQYGLLYPNTTAVEGNTGGGWLRSWASDGFDVDVAGPINTNNQTYVAWNWKANGSGSANTNGSITSTVSANVDAGFSIVSYTGTGSNATVGHGLSVAPEMIIIKRRNDIENWIVGHEGIVLGSGRLQLDTTVASSTGNADAYWNTTAPSATLVSLGDHDAVNGSSDTYIIYAFHSVDGYSKVGSYVGNGDTDGTFIYTGFRPRYFVIKRTDSADDWNCYDSIRSSTGNPMNETIYLNGYNGEAFNDTGHDLDFLSSGVKLRTTNGQENASGGTYIYIAFAEIPFKYSNAK